MREAKAALKELQQQGIAVLQLDQFGHLPGSEVTEEMPSQQTAEFASNAGLVLGSTLEDDAASLLQSDPAASSMANATPVRGRSIILTAITDDDHLEQAVQTIKKLNGFV